MLVIIVLEMKVGMYVYLHYEVVKRLNSARPAGPTYVILRAADRLALSLIIGNIDVLHYVPLICRPLYFCAVFVFVQSYILEPLSLLKL